MNIDLIALVMFMISIGSGFTTGELALVDYMNNGCNDTVQEPPVIEIPPVIVTQDGGKVILFSDVHTFEYTINKFQMFIDWSNGINPIYGYGLGDMIDDPKKIVQYDTFVTMSGTITYPTDYVMGNHDSQWADNDMLLQIRNNTCFALMNSYNGCTHGCWNQQQEIWLETTMQNANCTHFAILSHHEMSDSIKSIVESKAYLYQTVRHYHGHNHWFSKDSNNNVDYITVPSVKNMDEYNNPAALVIDVATGQVELCYSHKGCISK